MKKLGLIGGTGPESTLIYYKKLVYGANQLVGKDFFPNLSIESLNVFDVLKYCAARDYPALTQYLMQGIDNLVAAGCEVVSLTGNTPHIVFDALRAQSSVPLVSIIETARDAAKKRGFKKLGLLGTRFTMEEDFFKKPFRDAGMEIVTPDGCDFDFVVSKISEELEHGLVKPETQEGFLNIIQKLVAESGIDAVVLGCTELPLLFNGLHPAIPCLDTLEIHAEALLGAMELSR
ncbi:aspartate/glutamate racemase family protein [Acetobacter fabarum]|uniref:aspartate/glutamate racemase family protein n=1 Tax=Acetobacter fabarum TaxID=483199 RepID=UPI0020A1220A|nr:amino acid racemase [Acetobacter fabarum]MCP1229132.1 amino acid racemase [Acetobacter fabarum]MCP1234644.1 amino acid racemase [Acetobacter fabarum]